VKSKLNYTYKKRKRRRRKHTKYSREYNSLQKAKVGSKKINH